MAPGDSAALLDKRLLNGEGRATTRLVAACATAPAVPARRGEEDAPSKIAAEFLFRGLRARIDAIELNHVLRSHTAGRGPQLLSRGALAHSVRVGVPCAVWCDSTARLRSAERESPN